MYRRLLISILPLISVSCLKFSDPVFNDVEQSFLSGPGVFVMNEGNFRSGNGSLSFYSYDSAKLFNHVFLSVNERPLGDVPYSMNIYGNKAYIVVNNSGKIEVVERQYLRSVSIINGLKSPRYIAFISNYKAYVTSLYSDSVAILDLSSNKVSGFINLGHSSESVLISYSKAFIANWAGGNKIFIVNTTNDQLTDSIEVGIEPESMVTDRNGSLWVLCNGGWQRENFAELIRINTNNNTIEKRFTFPLKTDSPTNLQIDGEGETLYYLHNGVKKMNIYDSGLPETNFISHGDYNFYKMGVNPLNSDIFITDAADFQRKGNLLLYNRNGGLVSLMQADIIPGSLCFKVDFNPVIE